ncbi:uncharacterized protein LOC126574758 [Anopheles aquasalis]|uniref:uncharacterized protein LOC126574758 n=1 Tax=Anopheles aquasalis TaxID=42839 RepID=UPI00215ADA1B|nr:uncharacterized protein LOC126574758 [Anopheles aquasalis]
MDTQWVTHEAKYYNQLKALKVFQVHLLWKLRAADLKEQPFLVPLHEKMLRDTFTEAWRVLPQVEGLPAHQNERKEFYQNYIDGLELLEALKQEMKPQDKDEQREEEKKDEHDQVVRGQGNTVKAKVAPMSKVAADSVPNRRKTRDSLIQERLDNLAQFDKIPSLRSYQNQDKPQILMDMIKTLELVKNSGLSFLSDELLVSLALSKLDSDTLGFVLDSLTSTNFPTWIELLQALSGVATWIEKVNQINVTQVNGWEVYNGKAFANEPRLY